MSKNTQPDPPEKVLRVPTEGDIPEIIEGLGEKARALWTDAKVYQMEADKAHAEYTQWHTHYLAKQAEVKSARTNAMAGWAAYCQYRYENGLTAPEPLEARNGGDVDLANTTVDVAEFFEDITRAEELPGKL